MCKERGELNERRLGDKRSSVNCYCRADDADGSANTGHTHRHPDKAILRLKARRPRHRGALSVNGEPHFRHVTVWPEVSMRRGYVVALGVFLASMATACSYDMPLFCRGSSTYNPVVVSLAIVCNDKIK